MLTCYMYDVSLVRNRKDRKRNRKTQKESK